MCDKWCEVIRSEIIEKRTHLWCTQKRKKKRRNNNSVQYLKKQKKYNKRYYSRINIVFNVYCYLYLNCL